MRMYAYAMRMQAGRGERLRLSPFRTYPADYPNRKPSGEIATAQADGEPLRQIATGTA